MDAYNAEAGGGRRGRKRGRPRRVGQSLASGAEAGHKAPAWQAVHGLGGRGGAQGSGVAGSPWPRGPRRGTRLRRGRQSMASRAGAKAALVGQDSPSRQAPAHPNGPAHPSPSLSSSRTVLTVRLQPTPSGPARPGLAVSRNRPQPRQGKLLRPLHHAPWHRLYHAAPYAWAEPRPKTRRTGLY